MKKLTIFSLLLMGLTSFNAWANTCGDCDATGYIYVDKQKLEAENKAIDEARLKKTKELINLDNKLTQKYESNKDSIPFVDYLDQVKEITKKEDDLYEANLYTGTKKTIQALIDFHQNYRKNMDKRLKIAKQRNFGKYDQLEKLVLKKRDISAQKEQILRGKLKKAE